MLRIRIDSDEIEVWFDHKVCEPGEIESVTGVYVEEDRKCSTAKVCLNGKVVGRGMSICNPGDNFCKAIGRKKALAFALFPLTRSVRKAVWSEYKLRCNI